MTKTLKLRSSCHEFLTYLKLDFNFIRPTSRHLMNDIIQAYLLLYVDKRQLNSGYKFTDIFKSYKFQ